MLEEGSAPVSAFAMYSQSSQESESSNPKKQNKRRKRNKNTSFTDVTEPKTNGNLKISMKAKNKNKKAIPKQNLENIIINEVLKKKQSKKQTIDHSPIVINKSNKLQNGTELNDEIDFAVKSDRKQKKASPEVNKKEKTKLKQQNVPSSPPKEKSKKKNKTRTLPFQTNAVKEKSIGSTDSIKTGEEIFSWLISPVENSKFFRDNWEKQPIIIKRKCSSYYSYLLSGEEIDKALRKQQLFFTKNIDITSYSPQTCIRQTHNPPGQATAPLVWDYYSNGCSIRILNPQTFFPKVHALNAALQEYFECFVGANVYLTPAGTQGFAPHYDDIEAFVIQLEGEKLWKLYLPRTPAEILPRFSSGNFTEADLGPPIQEVHLKAGDMLYFPRGIIHQGTALENTHSLHITLSMYQKTSWADLLETLLPAALKFAIEEDVSFREGLPMHYLSHLGLVNSDKTSKIRTEFLEKLQTLISKLVTHAPVDAAVDQLGKRFIHDALPPFLRTCEKDLTVFGDGEVIQNGVVRNQAEMCLGTSIKLVRYHCVRVIREEEAIRIYYSISNSKEYHGEEAQYLEIDEDLAPAIDALISAYPNFITVEDLPVEDEIAKVQIASDLWERGIVMTEEPLGYSSD